MQKQIEDAQTQIVETLKSTMPLIRTGSPKQRKSTNWWTYHIKNSICALGTRHNFYVSSSDVDDHNTNNGEWLYDVTWLNYSGPKSFPDNHADRQLRRVYLALESEMGNLGDIFDDFEKLIQSTAQVRVFTFSAATEKKFNSICGLLKTAAENYETHLPASYVLAGFPASSENEPMISLFDR
tara:strand:+ start:1222 stop:1767 length:546 start_codon:yes stop_codon:yes gene_type:complete